MATSKRQQAITQQVDPLKHYPIEEALTLLKKSAADPAIKTGFKQAIDLVVKLGVDAKKSDQVVRGFCTLPHGNGKATGRVAVFATGKQAEAAQKAGADEVGTDELADSMKQGGLDFEVVIATPEAMRTTVAKLGQLLGPKGLMPNPKLGTVTEDVTAAVESAKKGQVRFRNNNASQVHCRIGDVEFDDQALLDNLRHLMAEIKRLKPSAAKGVYLQSLHLSTTMGPGVKVDIASVGI